MDGKEIKKFDPNEHRDGTKEAFKDFVEEFEYSYLLCYFVDDFPFLSTASQSAFLPLGPCWAIARSIREFVWGE